MSDTRDPATDQPLPRPTGGAAIADLVCADLQRRKEHGARKYGTPLQAHNGRSAPRDAYEEVLDLAQYLKQQLEEEPPVRLWLYASAPRELRAVFGPAHPVALEEYLILARTREDGAALAERLSVVEPMERALGEGGAYLFVTYFA